MSSTHLLLSRCTTWLLVVLLLVIGAAGDALHWVPGCGHGVEVGDTIVWLGIAPDTSSPPSEQGFTEGAPLSHPVYDEAECGICSAAGNARVLSDAPAISQSFPLVQLVPVEARVDVQSQASETRRLQTAAA